MSKRKPLIVDETNLYEGMKNLATGYFDTISEFNRPQTDKPHFSYQTVKDLDWGDAVKRILGDKKIKDVLEKGKSMLAEVGKVGIGAAIGVGNRGRV